MDEKSMQIANFNITFGASGEPMLTHFEDIIYPVLTGDYIRGKKDELPQYYFDNVHVREIDDEYVVVGNYVKSMVYKVKTTYEDGELVSSPEDVPTAPYSRFIIFLRNHRMILVKNETKSPDVRSFQKTLREILKKFIRERNDGLEKNKRLPYAITHIVGIPFEDTIEEVFLDISKINWIKLRFFPLNNDLDTLPIMKAFRDEMKAVGSKTGNLTMNSPSSKEGVKKALLSTGGLATASMQVTDDDGETRNIKEDSFSANSHIAYEGNLASSGDVYLVAQAKKNDAILTASPDNVTLYERVKDRLKHLLS